MMRKHILITIAEHRVFSAEQYNDAKSVCRCEPDDRISRVAGLVAGIDALRSDLSAAEHLLHEATTGAKQVNDELASLRKRLAEAEAVLRRCGKTADGVWVVPFDPVYNLSLTPVRGVCQGSTSNFVIISGDNDGVLYGVPTADCYSTREAAEKARGA